MSAYVVDNQTISKILVGVRFLNNGINNSWLVRQLTNGRLTNPFQHVDWDDNEDLQSIGKKMFDLNCKSVNGRYDDRAAEFFTNGEPFVFEPTAIPNKIQLLKAIRSYLYQSCEGGCDSSALYKALSDFSYKLAFDIVTDLPQYNQSDWG